MTATENKSYWAKRRIGDDCIVGDGAHAKIKRQASGILYLTCKNFKNGGLDLSKVDYISEEDYHKYFRESSKALTKVKADDVLFSIIGTIGEPYLVNFKDHFGISSSVSILRPDTTVLYPKYVYYWIKGHIFQNALYAIKGGVAQGYVSLEMIKALPLHYPELPIQRKIAAIFSAYDDLIENNTKRIEILEEMARSLYHEWFVKFRFPGHEQVKMVDSELGPVPEGWQVQKLEEVADINKTSLKTGDAPEKINYIDISSVSTGKIDKIEPIIFSKASSRARRIVKHGDIIWATVRPNRKSYSLILKPIQNLIVSTGFAVITGIKVPYTYLYQALTTDDFVGYLTNNATGSAYPAVNTGDFKNANLLIPPIELIDKFHNIVEDIVEEKDNFLRKNDNLRQTRDLLLPKLISGEIKVENLNINTEEIAA